MAVLDVERLDPIRARRPDEVGGEWDYLRALPARTARQLRGAGLLGRRLGVPPDDLADQIRRAAGGDLSDCDALALWVRESVRHIEARRREQRRRRQERLARREGFESWWAYRTHLARCSGFESVHQMAKAKAWR